MFRFESPNYFQYLFFLPVLIFLSFLALSRAQKKLEKAFGYKILPMLVSSVSIKKRKFKIILQALTLATMIICMARPQAGQSKQEVKSEGIELVFVVDVSESMLADDLRPSRLEQAKIDLSRLVDQLTGHKIGLVAFAGSSALLSPLTNDPASLKLFIDSLSTSSVSSQGTNFQEALQDAKLAFEHGGVEKDEKTVVTRAILILSDGEDHEKGALNFVRKLTEEGIRIFSIAYGTEKGAPISQRDSLGYLKGYKKDSSGNTILTKVDGQALKALAEEGKGSFFFASAGSTYLHQLVEDINKLEKSQFESSMAIQYDEKFQLILIFGFIFGLLELFLGDRRNDFRLWQGRFEVPKA